MLYQKINVWSSCIYYQLYFLYKVQSLASEQTSVDLRYQYAFISLIILLLKYKYIIFIPNPIILRRLSRYAEILFIFQIRFPKRPDKFWLNKDVFNIKHTLLQKSFSTTYYYAQRNQNAKCRTKICQLSWNASQRVNQILLPNKVSN